MSTATQRPSEVATHQAQHPAVALQQKYGGRLVGLVPSHVNGDAWLKQATGTLRDEKLAEAAANDFGSFVAAIERAAVLGLRPGSEEFYLRPVKIKGRLQVQGIVGYQGLVDLMYRSGAVASVVVEVVYSGDDFRYAPGRDERPIHDIDWDAEDRGTLRLAYAYAVMMTGATSKVVVLNHHDIERIKKSSEGSGSEYSPWRNHEAAMWLKSAARQLAKWVPTSTEYIAQQAQARAIGERERPAMVAAAPQPAAITPGPASVDVGTGELLDDGYDPDDPTTHPDYGKDGGNA